MSSQSGSLSAAPWRGAAPAAARELLGGAVLLATWIALWSFFILAVAVPAAQVHRASASLAADAVAAGEPCSEGRR